MSYYTQQKFRARADWENPPGPPLERPLVGANCTYVARGNRNPWVTLTNPND